ncbi:DUF6730 family protein [Maribacter sp. 2304DJ31-5]|uniref:DUF6730 family protein n=1 Tax=Maribacter sp. 2304DJ31-5 TaxID=3386273 RepID=UPI0039BC3A13
MTKIEQLAELLVSELKGFEKGITKLEALETKISNTKVELNLKELKPLLQAQENAISESKSVQESYLYRLQSVVKGASFYPKWAIITFMSMILMCCFISFYAYTIKTEALASEKEAHQKGINTYGNYMIDFFKEYPNAKKQFEAWQNKNE